MENEMVTFKSTLLTLMNLFQASGDKTIENIIWELVKKFDKMEDLIKGKK